MTSALVLTDGRSGPVQLQSDLEAVGIQVLAVVDDCRQLVREVVQHAPDVVIGDVLAPGDALFRVTEALAQANPVPVVLFTPDTEVTLIERAIASGIHVYVANGYAAQRLRPLIHLAQARAKREQTLKDILSDLTQRLEDRKAVERAKGILMQARQVSDDEAFRILRTVSMHANQRLGQVSQHIIHSAHFAESVNRAGQLRMLSQRMVKLYLLQLAGVSLPRFQEAQAESMQRTEAHLAWLSKKISPTTFADVLERLVTHWAAFKALLQAEARTERLAAIDDLADSILQDAEALTSGLESAGNVAPLHVLNIAGRQRMWSQRFAKHALLSLLGADGSTAAREASMGETRLAFEKGLTHLNGVPLSTPDIRQGLDAAAQCWRQMLHGATRGGGGNAGLRDRLERLAVASEAVLDVFEDLSTRYEHSLDMLVG